MNIQNLSKPLLAALLIAGCSQGPTAPTATPGKSEKLAVASGDGVVQGSAAGDVNVGPNQIEMSLVRVSQTDGVPAFYANANGEYVVSPARDTEIYIQIWTSNPPVQNPRVITDWGNGQTDNTGCGSCRLTMRYNTEGRYRVTVTLDDRVSSRTSRSFTLNVRQPERGQSGFGTFAGSLSTTDPQFNRASANFVPPATGPCGPSGNIPNYYDTYRIHHTGGTLRIDTFGGGTLNDTYLHLIARGFSPGSPCQNMVASNDDSPGGSHIFNCKIEAIFPEGDYVVVVTSFDPLDTGTYTLLIR